jgi:peptidoglycan/LPS O-acetylase OafA/YrhL
MSFPVYLRWGPLTIHPHFLFESMAYFVGFRIFLRLRRGAEHLTESVRWSVVAAAIVGALLGSKLLAWAEEPQPGWQFFLGGKTIVGGLLGGMIAVEWRTPACCWRAIRTTQIKMPTASLSRFSEERKF